MFRSRNFIRWCLKKLEKKKLQIIRFESGRKFFLLFIRENVKKALKGFRGCVQIHSRERRRRRHVKTSKNSLRFRNVVFSLKPGDVNFFFAQNFMKFHSGKFLSDFLCSRNFIPRQTNLWANQNVQFNALFWTANVKRKFFLGKTEKKNWYSWTSQVLAIKR